MSGRFQGEGASAVVDLQRLVHDRRDDIQRLATKHGAISIRLFGSVARGDTHAKSDVDFLIEMAPDRSLFDLIGLKQSLEDLLGVRVDVADPNGLHWTFRDQALAEAVAL